MGNRLVTAQVLTILLPVGIGPFMADGVKSVVGWLQAVGVLLSFVLPVALLPNPDKTNDDNEVSTKTAIVNTIVGIISIGLFILYIISLVQIFNLYQYSPPDKIVRK